uniref:Uncharacterized protein n=1 Tax=Bicosoecida sp. CB-2014 TaxID=1486930 RepID=A0A7S1G814_9STRA|mmetsp:Transcript_19779/g.70007  ORF Transcript_19779/g.70007 Transcript_19779/m.70007 type:complete len:135 (+) Transcript_19779:205-609(+)
MPEASRRARQHAPATGSTGWQRRRVVTAAEAAMTHTLAACCAIAAPDALPPNALSPTATTTIVVYTLQRRARTKAESGRHTGAAAGDDERALSSLPSTSSSNCPLQRPHGSPCVLSGTPQATRAHFVGGNQRCA